MELELRSFSSADVGDVTHWIPSSPEEVFFDLGIEIGEKGVRGADVFQLVVATPQGLLHESQKFENYRFPDRYLLVFSTYSWEIVLSRLERIVRHCSRDSWEESVVCLQRYFGWEYEDYYRDESPE